MKLCTLCKTTKDISQFSLDKSRKDGRSNKCRECSNRYSITKHYQNKEFNNARSRKWHHSHPKEAKNNALKRKFGMLYDDYEKMLLAQDGVCAICHNPNKNRSLIVDHNHTTNAIRELLCDNCNKGIGFFLDDIELLRKAMKYLKKHNG